MRTKHTNNLFEKAFEEFYWAPSSALIRSIEAKLLSQIKFKRPILDVGCGNGMFASFVFDRIDVGIDISAKDLKLASKRKIYNELKETDTSLSIPYPNNYFSSVFSNSTLEHIENLDGVLREINRVLKLNGDFVITSPTNRFPFTAKHYKHYNLLSLKQWKEKLKKHGFRIIKYKYYLSESAIKAIKNLNAVFELGFVVGDHGLQLRQILKIPLIGTLFKNYFKKSLRKYYDEICDSGYNLMVEAKKIRTMKM